MGVDESEDRTLHRVRVKISGRVQGVAFRWSTREKAASLGLSGWVKNLLDGDVEAAFQGDAKVVSEIIDWCWQGPPGARVTGVDVTDIAPESEALSDFKIRY